MKPLYWIASSKKDLLDMPREVVARVGYALDLAQRGAKHPDAKVLHGFGSAGVLELIEDFYGNAYRAVYTVCFEDTVYVLHCFQKKSTQGIAMAPKDKELILRRLGSLQRGPR
jgi:phage-related protein